MMGRIAGQGALLFCGLGLAQVCAFLRNALIGTWLARGDFGIAAVITLTLQLLETLSDLGADRLIVQAEDGEDERLMGASHVVLAVRGLLTAAFVYLTAGPVVHFFRIETAQWAVEAASLVPLVKGFLHLDWRRQQRRLANGRAILIEAGPQALATALTLPVLFARPDFSAVVWLALLQAAAMVAASHALAQRPYHLMADPQCLRRIIRFGWPVWLSAFPLVAVYQGDRVLIGHLMGMEPLAGFSAAFMMAMVPGLLIAKVCHALLLPVLAAARSSPSRFGSRTRLMAEVSATMAAAYAMLLVIAGGDLLVLAFGPQYTGLGVVIGWLALMWALRMFQAVPGIALMALGHTRPLLVAGLVRAAALPVAAVLAYAGAGLPAIVAAGCAGEAASLGYVTWRAGREHPRLTAALLARALVILPITLLAAALAAVMPIAGWGPSLAAGLPLAAATIVAVAGLMPGLRRVLARRHASARCVQPRAEPSLARP